VPIAFYYSRRGECKRYDDINQLHLVITKHHKTTNSLIVGWFLRAVKGSSRGLHSKIV